MFKKLEAFFANSGTFVFNCTMSLIFFACWGFSASIAYPGDCVRYIVYAAIYFAVILMLLFAYKSGETNRQKALLGALLIFIARDTFDFVMRLEKVTAFEKALAIITTVLYAILFINHIIMQSDHAGNKVYNKLNNIILVLLIISIFLPLITRAMSGVELTAPDWHYNFAEIFTTFFVICMDTKVQVYKRNRAAAIKNGTWNEETRAKEKEIFKLD